MATASPRLDGVCRVEETAEHVTSSSSIRVLNTRFEDNVHIDNLAVATVGMSSSRLREAWRFYL